jgi:hypothetical protein
MTATDTAIEFDPKGSLNGTGRWYASGDVWFEIDPIMWAGRARFVVFRCHVIEDDPDEDWDSDTHASFDTYKAAVAAIPAFVTEERAARERPAGDGCPLGRTTRGGA